MLRLVPLDTSDVVVDPDDGDETDHEADRADDLDDISDIVTPLLDRTAMADSVDFILVVLHVTLHQPFTVILWHTILDIATSIIVCI